jgi:hypothetical protein
MESAGETARVAADVIYSLLKLAPVAAPSFSADLIAPQTAGLEELPA